MKIIGRASQAAAPRIAPRISTRTPKASVAPLHARVGAAPVLPWYRIENAENGAAAATIYIYNDIDSYYGVKAEDLVRAIGGIVADRIDVRINSRGGNVFDAVAIYNALEEHPATIVVHIDGLAASAASFLAMAGDEVHMPDNAYLMIHNPSTYVFGSAEDCRKTADLLDKVTGTICAAYCQKSGMSEEECLAAMAAETWYTGEEARSAGLVDAVEEEPDPEQQPEPQPTSGHQTRNQFDLSIFSRVPAALGGGRRGVTQASPIGNSTGGRPAGASFPPAPVSGVKEPVMSATQPAPAPTTAAAAPVSTPTPAPGTPAAPVAAPVVAQGSGQGAKPATIAELRAAFPGDAPYALEAAEKNLSLIEAKAGYSDILAQRLTAANAQISASAAGQGGAGKPAKPGTSPLGGAAPQAPQAGAGSQGGADDVGDGSAKAQFNAKVRKLVTAGEYDQAAAVRAVIASDPELHERMLQEANPRRAK